MSYGNHGNNHERGGGTQMRGKANSHKVANDQAPEGESPVDAKDAVIKYYKERK